MGRVGIVHRGGHFEVAGGRKHLEPRNGPGEGDVLGRLMACSQVAIDEARTDTKKHNWMGVSAEGVSYLRFEGSTFYWKLLAQ